ncbi:hypothetical protein [Sulfurovum riftiae]|uniref:UspA domain-containing protein n=1 Tax=Sulfurovum riftiae TaxID=1630136 RepID=A0A151CE28_9BACT|nr:hypothetical protein [Sulfurovum riftiae]KYJ85786.1 hypothetical protein AS592_03335 [Sulfurovum riftiae]
MLEKIEKVLVVIQETDKIESLLRQAIRLCEGHAAVMEILYIHQSPLFELPDYFKRSETEGLDSERVEKEIETTLERLGNTSSYAIFIKESETVDQVLALDKGEGQTCIISFYHEEITPVLARKVSSPLLVMKSEPKMYEQILFPVDLNENNAAFIRDMKTLFPSASIKLLYEPSYIVENYIFDTDFAALPLDPAVDMELDQEMYEEQKEEFEALKKETGLPGELVNEFDMDFIEYINTQQADLLVLHSENANFLFEDTISKELLSAIKTDLFIF